MIGLPITGVVGAAGSAATGGFSPAELFAAGAAGFWLDPLDTSTVWQDTSATVPATTAGHAVARIDDKSGRGNHWVQSSGVKCPAIADIGGLLVPSFDGSDDGIQTTLAEYPPTNKFDAYYLFRITKPSGMGLHPSNALFSSVWDSGSTSTSVEAPLVASTYRVNGSVVTKQRNTIAAAVSTGSWVVLDVAQGDRAGWPLTIYFGDFPWNTVLAVQGQLGGMLLTPATDDSTRAQVRTWLGARVGLSI